MTFNLPSIPAELNWKNDPTEWKAEPLTITAGAKCDLFIDPANGNATDNAPFAFFTPPDANFILSAKITVGFASMFDAGTLQVRERDDLWGKLCFEYSPQGKPMIVSVVGRGVADDCNSVIIEGNTVYLRIAWNGQTFAFHYSLDGKLWHLVRYFTLGKLENLRAGFSSQSPTGQGCTAIFEEISYRGGVIKDIRSGD